MTTKTNAREVRQRRGSVTSIRTASKRRTVRKPAASVLRENKPKTAYELCQRVCRHIAAERKTYFQGDWFRVSAVAQRIRMGATTDCGTTACRAGWMVALGDGPLKARIQSHLLSGILGRARLLLGAGSGSQLSVDVDTLFAGDACDGLKPGTRAYARCGVRGLRAFMAKHEAHLKARALEGV